MAKQSMVSTSRGADVGGRGARLVAHASKYDHERHGDDIEYVQYWGCSSTAALSYPT